jgi:hypothetical protein
MVGGKGKAQEKGYNLERVITVEHNMFHIHNVRFHHILVLRFFPPKNKYPTCPSDVAHALEVGPLRAPAVHAVVEARALAELAAVADEALKFETKARRRHKGPFTRNQGDQIGRIFAQLVIVYY